MESLTFEMISLILIDPAASHAYFKLCGAIEYTPKNRNLNLEAKQMIWSADKFTIGFLPKKMLYK